MTNKARSRVIGLAGILMIVAMLLAPALSALAAAPVQPDGPAQAAGQPPERTGSPARKGPPPRVQMLHGKGKVFDVRSLPAVPYGKDYISRDLLEEHEEPLVSARPGGQPAPIGSGLPASGYAPAPAPLASFEGLRYGEDCSGVRCGAGHPPDTNGDVGPTYYIQTVNTAIGIYDKSSGARVAAFGFNALMSQGSFGNLCDTNNYGDPVVLYDTFHDRWVISDFAFKVDGSGNVVNPPGSFECFAVSKSGDPVSGGWNFYSINIVDGLQDYPKLGIWPDGLYMSANMFGFAASGGYMGARVWALNLAQMEAGSPDVQMVSFNPPTSYFSLLPSNARLQTGTPPAGAPNYFSSVWTSYSTVQVWKFHVDWVTPTNSTFTGPTNSSAGSSWAGAPDRVASLSGNNLDTLATRLMMQNQYANIGGVESLWMTHTVRGSSSSQAAVRWYQVPVTGGVVGSALQASTWNPDALNRFTPSLAVDKKGNMGIGYSVSSSGIYPAIRYAGRLTSDPLNTLGQTETSLIEGTGTQVGNCGNSACTRWGDYSAMTLDPDGCTFWFTTEYYAVSGLDDHTRIGSFQLPGCTGPTTGTLSGTIKNGSNVVISGATVKAGANIAISAANGTYSFADLAPGPYAMTVTAAGYNDAAANVTVVAGQTTTQNFTLGPAPVLVVTAASGVYGGATSLTATLTAGGSGLAGKTIAFQLNGAAAGSAVSDASGKAVLNNISLSGINAGSYPNVVTASFAGDGTNHSASGANGLTVGKASQSISFGALDDRRVGDADFDLTAAATSGLTVSFSAGGSCTVSGSTVHLTGAGTCKVTASQGGSSNYSPAQDVLQSFAVWYMQFLPDLGK